MEQVAFFIDKISYGWFDDSFKGSDWQVAISASDAWGTDAPALLPQGLIQQRNADIPAPLYVIIDYDFFLHSVYRAFYSMKIRLIRTNMKNIGCHFP